MNFDNIKAKMDSENMDGNQIPTQITDLESSKMPIEKVRKSMRSEIIMQLIAIVIFFAVPSFIEIYELPKAIYYILMFITSLITLGYLAKMTWFLNKTSNLNNNSRETLTMFIHDLKLTLEVYKTAIISGSVILPLPLIALALGTKHTNIEIFTDLIFLNVSPILLILCICGYIVLAVLMYYITIAWANKLYGIHIEALENTLKEFND